MERRRVLAATALLGSAGLAGCPLLAGSGERTTLRLRAPTHPGATPASELRADQLRLVREAAATGSATAYGYDPFDRVNDRVRVDGSYYRVATERGASAAARKPVLVVEQIDGATDAVPLETYDAATRELIRTARDRGDPGTVPLHPDTTGADPLRPTPRHEHVTWAGETYRLRVEEQTGRYLARTVTVESVAETRAGYEDYVREELAIALHSERLSTAEQDVVAAAIEDSYEETAPYSDAFEQVLERVRRGTEVRSEWLAGYLVAYRATGYRADVERVAWEP